MKFELKNVCAFGDSVMKGIVVDNENSPEGGIKYKISNKGFAARCRERLDIEVENFARFGGVVSHGKKLLGRYVDKIKKSDFVLFEYGGNDCDYNWSNIAASPDEEHLPNTPIPQFVNEYSSLIDDVKALGSNPVLLSLPVLDPVRFFKHVTRDINAENVLRWLGGSVLAIDRWHARYNMEIFRLGALKKVPVIDITSVFLERKNFSDYICEDGIHPNEHGHALIESAIIDYLGNYK
jgi:lysophospholipase L1-like esterase